MVGGSIPRQGRLGYRGKIMGHEPMGKLESFSMVSAPVPTLFLLMYRL